MDCIPFMEPGRNPTCRARSVLVGARFVAVATGVNATDGLTQVDPCGAGEKPYGVAARDTVAAEPVLTFRGGEVPIEAGAALAHGQPVMSDAVGRAVPFAVLAGAKATRATGVEGDENAITWTADLAGAAGNDISVEVLGSTGDDVALAVAVVGRAITVTPATDGAGVITSTADQVKAAVEASAPAAALVDVADTGASDGTGLIAAVAAGNLAGGTGDASGNTRAGVCCGDAANGAPARIALELGA